MTRPPETFGATGTMTNTVVLFLQKFGSMLRPTDDVEPAVARIDNVGFDATGRVRQGNQLTGLGRALRAVCYEHTTDGRIERGMRRKANQTLPNLPEIVKGDKKCTSTARTVALGDFLTLATTGTTPSRTAYSDHGLFLVKVGNLTGAGVNWIPRDRNFIDPSTAAKRHTRPDRFLQPGDIVLTSSAHSPKYIARKIDVIQGIPDWVGGRASFVGEVMLLRPNQELIDPFVLAAYLRLPTVIEEIQYMVRGQTAHLHPTDLVSLRVNEETIASQVLKQKLAIAIREESELSLQMNEIAWKQIQMSAALVDQMRLS